MLLGSHVDTSPRPLYHRVYRKSLPSASISSIQTPWRLHSRLIAGPLVFTVTFKLFLIISHDFRSSYDNISYSLCSNSIARQYVQSDTLYVISDRPSVGLYSLLVLWRNYCIYRQIFIPSGSTITLVFRAQTVSQNSDDNPQKRVKYEGRKICVVRQMSPIISETVRDSPTVTMDH